MSRIVIWVASPLLATAQIFEASLGRYDARLAIQAGLHLFTCGVLLLAKSFRARAMALLVYFESSMVLILLHYGPTLTVGIGLFAALFLGQVFFSRRGLIGVLLATAAVMVISAVHFVALKAPWFRPEVGDLRLASTWIRLGLVSLCGSAALGWLLVYVVTHLERSASDAEAALHFERRERAAREALELERSKAEGAMALADRQELVTRLATGAAHDLNNVLMAISGSVDMAELDLEAGEKAAILEGLRDIRSAAQRGSGLGRQLLSFSRRQSTQPRVVMVDEVLTGSAKLLRRLLPSNIQLELDIAVDCSLVFADPGQLEQVAMNLVVNARDAMPGGGRVAVRVANGENTQGEVGVLIRVSDDGPGVPEEIRQKIFEPFFTTKGEGRGTGLGLATVRSIVEACSGSVWLETAVGRGAKFSVWLPAVAGQKAAVSAGAESVILPLDPGGQERILIADDDADVRRLAKRMLESAGYHAETARDGDETLQKASESEFDLIIMDAIMPGVSGAALVTELERRHPGVGLLFSTAYDPGVFGANFFAKGNRRLLTKPYQRRELLEATRSVLDALPRRAETHVSASGA